MEPENSILHIGMHKIVILDKCVLVSFKSENLMKSTFLGVKWCEKSRISVVISLQDCNSKKRFADFTTQKMVSSLF